MRFLTIAAALLISGCVSVADSTKPEMETVEEAIKDTLPAFIPTRFVCEDKEDIIRFVNIDMFRAGRTGAQHNAELGNLVSQIPTCTILRRIFFLVPFERVLSYMDQAGIPSAVFQVYVGQRTGYVVAIDPHGEKKNMNLPSLRDKMKRVKEEVHHMTTAEIEGRLETLTDALTEIIVDQARPPIGEGRVMLDTPTETRSESGSRQRQ
jgi:hypothetical protein